MHLSSYKYYIQNKVITAARYLSNKNNEMGSNCFVLISKSGIYVN
ncbi:hypothetical protein BN1221_04872c [Brenneria goodwinii]|uniref:Uncharacterized protein n=1 Tax=Brenneria goodwinii TaxID=1109412 RepID=A0A0G4K2D3_9GAMM|nr:hypothetical protein BN1221_04872c [Brenneria goodwinii]